MAVERISIEAPAFSLEELRELRIAFTGALMYVGPVGLSEHALKTWKQAKHWRNRLDSLIAEYEDWLGAGY